MYPYEIFVFINFLFYNIMFEQKKVIFKIVEIIILFILILPNINYVVINEY